MDSFFAQKFDHIFIMIGQIALYYATEKLLPNVLAQISDILTFHQHQALARLLLNFDNSFFLIMYFFIEELFTVSIYCLNHFINVHEEH